MRATIEFEECLKDSPRFRQFVSKEESDIEHLEQRLEKIIKLCNVAVDSGKEYVKNQSAFAMSLWDLQQHFLDNKNAHNALGKLIHCFQEMNKFHTILLDQASRTVLKNLSVFVKDDINQVKDYKGHFLKVSEGYDNALIKNAQASKNRPQEMQEAANILSASKSCFQHTALDYVNYITLAQARKVPSILSTLLDYYQACVTYYHQGFDLCNDFDEFFKNISEDLNTLRGDYQQLEKAMQNRHMSVNRYCDSNTNSTSNKIEGYLFKKKSKGFKTWCRRWFYLSDNQLVYSDLDSHCRKRSNEDSFSVMEEDLRICSVRPVNEGDRRFCFEVISPTKSHILQADSADMLSLWISALQHSIGAAIQHDSTHHSRPQSTNTPNNALPAKRRIHWEEFLKIPGNAYCCDCRSPEPRWASINLGITLCIECSGVHRSLGVHYSKVRSLTLDAWETENVKVMMELGNEVVNRIYEARIGDDCGLKKPTEQCEIGVREAWIKAKYVERRFVCGMPKPQELLASETAEVLSIDSGGVVEDGESGGSGIAKRATLSLGGTRKWAVKKLRRRQKQRPLPKTLSDDPSIYNTAKTGDELDDDDDDESINIPSMSLSISRDDLLVIGDDLALDRLETPGILGSDQESTDGESDAETPEELPFSQLDANQLLYMASVVHNLPVMCMAFALGADKVWKNPQDRQRSFLHQAVISGSVMACEFLLLNGAAIDAVDEMGYSALHISTAKGHIAQVYLLLKHKAAYDLASSDGKKALDIAVDQENADIVTLLRLTQLNDEIGPNDEYNGEDETYKNVMKDFSKLPASQTRVLRQRHDSNTLESQRSSLTNSD
ncbi:arf-GAP with coiled-coil, ANK repeat and PH domain-containing protein 2 isoform X1 [Drosophila subpulchrella]|uniref:arf-GAP with coiled-coil, ANK repeat and PH domain-containing protein 2 isoform X1 n=1 Tax=Drosophila subpulchrella TaxID=1486046 RepID=UPI0018A15D5E|nr:arf-GAP with coiled-coil, ANK repeat and PH domain-containing protein 2 isoform X1 [Drosophila subpulchrella]